MSADANTIQTFSTEDMTLVTVLKMRGLEPDSMVRSGRGCQWVYLRCNALDEILDEYSADECFVEPRDFSRKLGLVRTEMYRFLGISPRRVPRG